MHNLKSSINWEAHEPVVGRVEGAAGDEDGFALAFAKVDKIWTGLKSQSNISVTVSMSHQDIWERGVGGIDITGTIYFFSVDSASSKQVIGCEEIQHGLKIALRHVKIWRSWVKNQAFGGETFDIGTLKGCRPSRGCVGELCKKVPSGGWVTELDVAGRGAGSQVHGELVRFNSFVRKK